MFFSLSAQKILKFFTSAQVAHLVLPEIPIAIETAPLCKAKRATFPIRTGDSIDQQSNFVEHLLKIILIKSLSVGKLCLIL